jgi:hypothetical protein
MAILFLSAIAIAVPVGITEPFSQTVDNGDSIFIGTIGPGQTLEVQMEPKVSTGGIYGQIGRAHV